MIWPLARDDSCSGRREEHLHGMGEVDPTDLCSQRIVVVDAWRRLSTKLLACDSLVTVSSEFRYRRSAGQEGKKQQGGQVDVWVRMPLHGTPRFCVVNRRRAEASIIESTKLWSQLQSLFERGRSSSGVALMPVVSDHLFENADLCYQYGSTVQ